MPTARILFLHPKTLTDSWPFPIDTLGEVIKAPSAVYPILAATIAHLPIQIEFFDGYVARETLRGYRARLARAEFLAISVMSPLKALDTELTLRLARAINPKVKIILGGNHASAFPERWIEAGADFVIKGEGEIAFPLLMEALVRGKTSLDEIPNLVYRDGDAIRATTIQAPAVALDETAFPDWTGFNLKPYKLGTGAGGFTAAVEISRGCPHRCDFCNINTFWGYKQRYKSVDRVIEELDRLHRLGVRELIFTDDNFAQDLRHTNQLLEEMVRRDFRFGFGTFLRGDTVKRNPQFAALAARAGMRFCLMGIETLDPAWLKDHRKGVKAQDVVEMYASVYRALHSNGIFLVGLFITPAEADRSVLSGLGVDGTVCDFHYSADLVAQKGSALFDNLSQRGAVGKDMFYHDWNLPSIVLAAGQMQPSRRNMANAVRDNVNGFAFRSYFARSPLARRFRWRHVGILAERLLCTSMADIRRYRVAKNESLPLAERQDHIVRSVLNATNLTKLQTRRAWKSPLSLRAGLWSGPHRPRIDAPRTMLSQLDATPRIP
jgi:anaerobic magnesium-protoporphyrin IX monomethyl ester cyclase